jgi:hypothetical protein
VFQGKSDPYPALYFGIGSMEDQVVLVRSLGGDSFHETDGTGLGLGAVDVPSIRTLTEYRGRLHTSPVGKNHDRGILDDLRTDFPIVFASDDPYRGQWEAVSEPGFGDEDNLSVYEMVTFNDSLYAAAHNPRRGYQIWRSTPGEGKTYGWRKVLDQGAWRGPANSAAPSMHVYKGALYVGGGLEEQGPGHTDASGPFGAELIRIHPNDSWDLIVGTPRATPHGFKRPLSGLGPGFDDRFVQAFWRMADYDGWLYMGGADWRFAPTYLPTSRNPRWDLSRLEIAALTRDTRAYTGGFGFWRTKDGQNWTAITLDGFNDSPYTYGIRELTPTPHGLFVGTSSSRSSRQGGGPELWWARPGAS